MVAQGSNRLSLLRGAVLSPLAVDIDRDMHSPCFTARLLHTYIHGDKLRKAANCYVHRDAIVCSWRRPIAATAPDASPAASSTTNSAGITAATSDCRRDCDQCDEGHICSPVAGA
jgi:hypothetical protein